MDQIVVVDRWDFEVPSTKAAQAALVALGFSGQGLVVLSREDERAFKSFRNLPEVDIVLVRRAGRLRRLCTDSWSSPAGPFRGTALGEAPAPWSRVEAPAVP